MKWNQLLMSPPNTVGTFGRNSTDIAPRIPPDPIHSWRVDRWRNRANSRRKFASPPSTTAPSEKLETLERVRVCACGKSRAKGSVLLMHDVCFLEDHIIIRFEVVPAGNALELAPPSAGSFSFGGNWCQLYFSNVTVRHFDHLTIWLTSKWLSGASSAFGTHSAQVGCEFNKLTEQCLESIELKKTNQLLMSIERNTCPAQQKWSCETNNQYFNRYCDSSGQFLAILNNLRPPEKSRCRSFLITSSMPFTNVLNEIGLLPDPCGTPWMTVTCLEKNLTTFTH